jgi:organic hydroperoxide reductase OsmC/OhrA
VLLGAQSLASSSALEFGGDETKSNPEMLLVGALSSCHMLWFLSLAKKKGFEVASYEDDAEGVLDGKHFTSATLRPRVRWAGEPPPPEAIEEFHHRSHKLCFIAASVTFPVEVEPQ